MVMLKEEGRNVGNRVFEMRVEGARRRGRQKRRWMDFMKNDLEEKYLKRDEIYDINLWKKQTRNVDLL